MHHIQNRPVREKQLSLQCAITVHGKLSQLKKANHENITHSKSFHKEGFLVFGNTFPDIINFLQVFIYCCLDYKNYCTNYQKPMRKYRRANGNYWPKNSFWFHFHIVLKEEKVTKLNAWGFLGKIKMQHLKFGTFIQSHYSLAVNGSRSKQSFFFRNSFIAHTVQQLQFYYRIHHSRFNILI